jgi:hypothetical protein
MRLWSNNSPWWQRALLLAPIVAANLIAASVPVLHSASHHHEHRDHAAFPVQGSMDEQHPDVHPSGLHDGWRIHGRVAIHLGFVSPARLELSPPVVELQLDLPTRVDAAETRPPPEADLARAPPTI